MHKHTIIGLLLFAGCGTDYYAQGTALAPSADLEVNVRRSDIGNDPISVEIKDLPPAHDIAPGAERFAVWSVPGGEVTPQLEGFLDYEFDEHTGRLGLVMPHREFTVIITAEPAETIPEAPSDAVVARRTVVG